MTQTRRGETSVAFDILKDIAGAAGLEALGDEASKLFHGGSGSSTPSSTASAQRRGIGFDILKDIAKSAGLEALGDEASKLFHGDSTTAPSPQPTLAPGTLSARFELPASVTDKATTKLLGFLGGLAASSGVDALFHHFEGNGTASLQRREIGFGILNDISSSAGLEALGDEASKLFHGDSTTAPSPQPTPATLSARFELPASVTDKAATKLFGFLGGLAASSGVDALFHHFEGNSTVSARAAPTSAAELVSTIEHGGYVTQADADALEAHLLRTLHHGQAHALAARFELPEVKLGSLTKGLVTLVGSLAASGGVDALFHEGSGNSTVAVRAEHIPADQTLHARTEMEARGVVGDFFGKLTDLIPLIAL
jgi:hypothetical protein